jgi:hypothetical protein
LIDILPIARWIDEQLNIAPVEELSKKIPIPSRITAKNWVNPESLPKVLPPQGHQTLHTSSATEVLRGRVGEALEYRYEPPAGTPESQLIVQEKSDGESFIGVLQNGLTRVVRPTRAGLAKIRYVLIDRQTLLAYQGEIAFEIQP